MKFRMVLAATSAMATLAGVVTIPTAQADTLQTLSSKCAWLSAPGGDEAGVCRTWNRNSDGTYWGIMQVTSANSGVYVQAQEDGEVVTITKRGQTGERGYDGFYHVYNRVCNSGCGNWW